MKRALFHLRWIGVCVGGAILFFFVRYIGIEVLLHELSQLRWWLPVIFSVGVLWNVGYTLSWQRILLQRRVLPFLTLFRIKLIGEAINASTPADFLGGDPVRIYLLKRFIPWTHAIASVVVDRTLQALATHLTVVIGAAVGFWHIPHIPLNIRYGLPIIMALVLGFIGFLFLHQQRGLLTFGLGLLRTVRLKRHFTQATIDRAVELDQLIAESYRRDPWGMAQALGFHLIGRWLGIIEVYIIGHVITPDFGWLEAIILASLAPLVNLLFSFVPGAFGVLEGTYSGILYLLKFSPSLGVTIQIVKRVRSGVWILIGYALLSKQDRKAIPQPMQSDQL